MKGFPFIANFFIPNQLLPPKTLAQRVYRLELGYFGIGMPSGIPSNMATRASSGLKSNECVNDHIIGATEIGNYIHQAFKEKDYDTDWMINKWLFENLFLWGTVKVTKEEHKTVNILRNSAHTVEQKIQFDHYLNVSEVL